MAFLLVPLGFWGSPLSTEEAPEFTALLSQIYSGAVTYERRVKYLTQEEAASLAKEAGVGFPTRRIITYLIRTPQGVTHYAYLELHIVRTKFELLFILIDERGRIKRIEVLGFAEPPEYAPPEGWLKTRYQLPLSDPETIRLPPLTGASLTRLAVSSALARVRVLHEHLFKTGFFR